MLAAFPFLLQYIAALLTISMYDFFLSNIYLFFI